MKTIIVERGEPSAREIDTPTLEGRDENAVLVKVHFAGLCGSDVIRIKNGVASDSRASVLGHEIVGAVLQSNTKEFEEGQAVVVMPLIHCGTCDFCNQGQTNFCSNPTALGKNTDGGFSEVIQVPARALYKVDRVDPLYTLTDPLACVIHALRSAEVHFKGKTICVIGDGTIGTLTVRMLSILEGDVVHIVKRAPSDSLAKTMLFEQARGDDSLTSLFDCTIECVGRHDPDTLTFASRVSKPGATVVVVGVFPKEEVPLSLYNFFSKELRLIGSNSFVTTGSYDEFGSALELLMNKKINTEGIITHTLPLTDFQKGLDLFENKSESQARKIVFKVA